MHCFKTAGGVPLNHFQVLLIDRSDVGAGNFDIEFNYDQVVWEAGTASTGDANCLGGSPARAGFANGSGTFQELAGSGVVSGFLDANSTTGLVNTSLNNSQLGRHIIPVRGGTPSLGVEADLSVTKTASSNPRAFGKRHYLHGGGEQQGTLYRQPGDPYRHPARGCQLRLFFRQPGNV